MKGKDLGYNRLLIGDIYHFESDQFGNLVIKENGLRAKSA